jgi:hypothetical protein
MNVDWGDVLARLRSYPAPIHNILPPCPDERIKAVEKQLGALPQPLADMLAHFNGAELFINGMPLVTIFGISRIPPLPPLEWAPDWYIDKFTAICRSVRDQQDDWAIAMMNYGGLILLDAEGTTEEWDTAQNMWGPREWTLAEWIEEILCEGDAFLKD